MTGAIRTAGALVWRLREGELQVQVVHRPRYDDWSLPKGKLEAGESLHSGGVREVAEETGKPVILGRPLPAVRYRLSGGRWKTVSYWAARRARTKADLEALASRDPWKKAAKAEIDQARWVTATHAREILTRESDLRPLEALVRAHEENRLDARALVISVTPEITPITAGVLAAYGVARAEIVPAKSGARPTVRRLLNKRKSTLLQLPDTKLPGALEALAEMSTTTAATQLPVSILHPGELLVAHYVHQPAVPSPTGKIRKNAVPLVVAVERLRPPFV